MKQQPNHPLVTKKLNACLEKGSTKFSQGTKVYDRMMNRLGDKIEVNNHNSVDEQHRLEWTTWSNTNVWFDTLKHFFVKIGFAHLKTKEDGDIEGELVFLNFRLTEFLI